MRAIIFDLDDTLYAHEQFANGGFAAVARTIAQRFGVSPARVQLALAAARRHTPGRELQTACRELGLPQDIIPMLTEAFRSHAPALTVFDGVDALLADLRRDGWRLALLTNGLPPVQARKVAALNLRERIEHIVYALDDAEGGKPHPRTFLEVVRRVGLPPADCVMVGDDLQCDIRGARAIGMRTVHVSRTPSEGEANATVSHVAQLPQVLPAVFTQGSRHVA